MEVYLPGRTEDELKASGGGTIENSLNVLKNNYNITAEVVNRKLTFDEVKQQIDNGQMVQMDMVEQGTDGETGTEENPGHAVLIVGYVVPKDGDISNKTPYYEIWNPWWGQTFYVSSNAQTINLSGTQYEWNRTWYNWKKVSSDQDIKIDEEIGELQVASSSNPNVLNTKINDNLAYNFLECPVFQDSNASTKLNSTTPVAQNGKKTTFKDFTHGIKFEYAEIGDGRKVWAKMYGGNGKKVLANKYTRQFITNVEKLRDLSKKMLMEAAVAVIMILLSLVAAGVVITAVKAILGVAGIGIASIPSLYNDSIDYDVLIPETGYIYTSKLSSLPEW